jgi:hypothetical protein
MIMQRGSGSRLVLLLGVAAASAALGCRKTADDETAQIGAAVGEVMSSLDESSQGGTTTAMLPALPMLRTPDALRGPAWRRALDAVFPSAYAAACGDTAFSACSAGARTRTFSACSLGLATLDGTVTLSFSAAPLCVVLAANDAVTRTADFTLTGLYGGTLAVTSPGGGQTLTKTATGFEYSVAGMERVLTGPGGRTLFDVSTRTTAPIVVTGSSRADLVIVSGALEVTHHLAGYKVTLTPSNLAWTATCNCAVSGSLTGTVSGGKHDGKSATVTLTGCGDADVTIDGQTDSITLDRCTTL